MKLKRLPIFIILLFFILASCSLMKNEPPGIDTTVPAPTNHYLFFSGSDEESIAPPGESEGAAVPTVARFFNLPVSTPEPKSPINHTSSIEPSQSSRQWLKTIPLYDDTVRPGWKFLKAGMEVEAAGRDNARTGNAAIAITPLENLGQFYLVVDRRSDEQYLRNNVFSLTFWITGGDDFIQLSDLVLTVLGSNTYSYWRFDDSSVDFGDQPYFSETRLYYLGLNRSIAPGEWAEVTIRLDDLIFDPDYQYFTGFYLKNDEGFWRTFYIDDVSIQLLVEEEEEAASEGPSSTQEVEEVSLPTPENTPPSTPKPTPIGVNPGRRE